MNQSERASGTTHLLWVIPCVLWVLILTQMARSERGGEAQFIMFTILALWITPVMLVLEAISVWLALNAKKLTIPILLGLILNASPLYFLKVFLWGPTWTWL